MIENKLDSGSIPKIDTSNFTHPYYVYLTHWNDKNQPRLRLQNMGTYASKYFNKEDINDSNSAIITKISKKEGKVNLTVKELELIFESNGK